MTKLQKQQSLLKSVKMSAFGFLLTLATILFPSTAMAATESCPTDDLALKLVCEFGNFIGIALIIAYFIGSILMLYGAFQFYATSRNPNDSRLAPWMSIFVGTLLLGMTEVITFYQDTLFNTGDVYEVSQYNESLNKISGGATTSIGYASENIMKAIFGFAKLVGVIAMIKSVVLIWDKGGNRRGNQTGWGQIIAFGIGGMLVFRAEDVACMVADLFNIQSLCLL